MPQLLFYTRLVLYLFVVAIPLVHPAVLVPYDLAGIGQWFVVVPGMMVLAFYLSPPLLKIRYWLIISAGFLLVIALFFGGFSFDALGILGAGLAAFILTVLVFKTEGKGRVVAAAEALFTGVYYFAFLNFSRSSEEIARASGGVLKILFVAAVVSLVLHAAVLFIASFPKIFIGRGKRNLFIFIGVLIPLLAFIAVLLPQDFIRNEVRLNPLEAELDRQAEPFADDSNSPFDGNMMDRFRRDRDGQLEGLDREQWQNLNPMRGGRLGGKQYAVMIVATERESLYLGSEYFGDFDATRGLMLSQDEPLNELAGLRLIETWRNPAPLSDRDRSATLVEIFSTIEDRFFAYRPESLMPMIMDRELRPFVYNYGGVFEVSDATEHELLEAGELEAAAKAELKRYLTVELKPEDEKAFRSYLNPLIQSGMTSYEKILSILNSYSVFQYELGFDERVHVAKILDFVLKTRTGDCTEFANATAILARLSGVPSRVVNGFLASRGLQLPKHKKGLQYLREQIEPLQKYGLDELLLVTTAHRHAWAQVYIDDYGWIDLEATAYAIPPAMTGDANQWNLVIPRYERGKEQVEPIPFPWFTVLLITGIVLAGIVIALYLFKYLRLLVIILASRSNTILGLKALRTLLLIRLITSGYAYKPPSRTILEYAETYPELADFAALYTELRYRERISDEEKTRAWQNLRAAYGRIKSDLPKKAKGPLSGLKHFFSLKGLLY